MKTKKEATTRKKRTAKTKVQESEKGNLKVQESEKEIKIFAEPDCEQGECMRYTVGKLFDDISGALYVKKTTKLPKEIKIIFKGGQE